MGNVGVAGLAPMCPTTRWEKGGKQMAKLLKMSDSHEVHVIQVNRANPTAPPRWRTIPGLVYSSRELACKGLGRLLDHAPHLKLRVRKWMGEPLQTLPLAA